MLVLAFDTAQEGCSVAVWRDGRVLAAADQPMRHGQAEALVPMIVAAMAAAQTEFAALDLIAATMGPGSFTGVRVGLATARGLALALDRPVRGVAGTLALAAGVAASERAGRTILSVVESRRADLFWQAFDATLKPQAPPDAATPEALAARFAGSGPLVLVGDGVGRLLPLLGQAVVASAPERPAAAVVAALAAAMPPDAAPPPEPIYIRPPDATPSACGFTA